MLTWTGAVQDREKMVELTRMDSMKIADNRRMFEFFNDIKLRVKVPCPLILRMCFSDLMRAMESC